MSKVDELKDWVNDNQAEIAFYGVIVASMLVGVGLGKAAGFKKGYRKGAVDGAKEVASCIPKIAVDCGNAGLMSAYKSVVGNVMDTSAYKAYYLSDPRVRAIRSLYRGIMEAEKFK